MAVSHRTRLAALGAISFVILSILTARPAGATPPLPDQPPIACATGEISDFALDTDEHGQVVLSISGWIQPCVPVEPTIGFALVEYYLAGGQPYQIWPYQSPSAPTEFHQQVDLYGVSMDPLVAVCLAAHDGRVACLVNEFDRPDGPHVVPVAPDDPRLPSGVKLPPFVLWPWCGTCV